MMNEDLIRLFAVNNSVIQAKLDRIKSSLEDGVRKVPQSDRRGEEIERYISQYSENSRNVAEVMASYYMIFHMLENEIRNFVEEVLEEATDDDWWKGRVPQQVREYAESGRKKEDDEGITNRSDRMIDYITFGHLGEIIKANWETFGGLLSSQRGVERVLKSLNMLRGPIAHCNNLEEDEVDRLFLAIRDWNRVSAGPVTRG